MKKELQKKLDLLLEEIENKGFQISNNQVIPLKKVLVIECDLGNYGEYSPINGAIEFYHKLCKEITLEEAKHFVNVILGIEEENSSYKFYDFMNYGSEIILGFVDCETEEYEEDSCSRFVIEREFDPTKDEGCIFSVECDTKAEDFYEPTEGSYVQIKYVDITELEEFEDEPYGNREMR